VRFASPPVRDHAAGVRAGAPGPAGGRRYELGSANLAGEFRNAHAAALWRASRRRTCAHSRVLATASRARSGGGSDSPSAFEAGARVRRPDGRTFRRRGSRLRPARGSGTTRGHFCAWIHAGSTRTSTTPRWLLTLTRIGGGTVSPGSSGSHSAASSSRSSTDADLLGSWRYAYYGAPSPDVPAPGRGERPTEGAPRHTDMHHEPRIRDDSRKAYRLGRRAAHLDLATQLVQAVRDPARRGPERVGYLPPRVAQRDWNRDRPQDRLPARRECRPVDLARDRRRRS
jgi:hypothetical protein